MYSGYIISAYIIQLFLLSQGKSLTRIAIILWIELVVVEHYRFLYTFAIVSYKQIR